MNILIFFGPAGSGKGTQAQYLSDKFNFLHLSTGDLLRNEVKSETSLGMQVQKVIEAGDLVSDDIILEIIRHNILIAIENNRTSGIVFDGFPRTIDQALAFDQLLNSINLTINRAVYFDLSLETSLQRISGRQIDSRTNIVYHKASNPAPVEVQPYLVTREDDDSDKVKHRYQVYQNETLPLTNHYADKLLTVDCLKTIDDIHLIFDELVYSLQVSAK
jgi:adenylate kinase